MSKVGTAAAMPKLGISKDLMEVVEDVFAAWGSDTLTIEEILATVRIRYNECVAMCEADGGEETGAWRWRCKAWGRYEVLDAGSSSKRLKVIRQHATSSWAPSAALTGPSCRDISDFELCREALNASLHGRLTAAAMIGHIVRNYPGMLVSVACQRHPRLAHPRMAARGYQEAPHPRRQDRRAAPRWAGA